MLYAKYTIRCMFEEAGTLNVFKGSALRGAFGHALKKAVCTVQKKECAHCILQSQCLYAQFFMEQPARAEAQSIAQPRPYIIEPPIDSKTYYAPNDVFEFKLILLGKAIAMLPFIIYAFELMGRQGLGKNAQDEHAATRFTIQDILSAHTDPPQSIYDAHNKQLLACCTAQELHYSPAPQSIAPAQYLDVQLETLLRFKTDNMLATQLSFSQLCRLMMRRISTIFAEWGEEELGLDYKYFLQKAEAIETIHSSLQWQDYTRYSNRQKQKLKLGGLIGFVRYKGDVSPFIPLLQLATLLHLGKQSSFGLGKISYSLKGNE